MRYCIHCGKEIKETAGFCPYCGKKQANKTRQEDSGKEIQFDTDALKQIAREKMSQAKELGKDISQQGRDLIKEGIDVLKEERASDVRNEYRILDNKRLRRYIMIMAILGLMCGLIAITTLVGNKSVFDSSFFGFGYREYRYDFMMHSLDMGLEMLVMFFLLISMHRVTKVYLSDQTSLFIFNVIVVLLGSYTGLSNIWKIYKEKLRGGLIIEGLISFCAIALSVAVVVLFYKIIKRKNRKKLLMFIFICMAVCKTLLSVGENIIVYEKIQEIQEKEFVQDFYDYYDTQYGESLNIDTATDSYYASRDELERYIDENEDIYGEDFKEFEENYRPQENTSLEKAGLNFILIILLQVIYHVALFLFILSIDNDFNKAYASKSEPDGRHIKTRSIGFSMILSILTLGIYYTFIWRYSIMSDIRKVRKMGSIALGEWLLYTFVPFYSFYWLYTRGSALTVVSENNRLRSTGSGGLFIFFQIILLGFINTMLLQNTLNALAEVMDKNFIYGDMIQTDYSASTRVADSQDGNIKKIKELYELKEKGIISEEEYEERKKHFLEQM
jgi:Putative p-aminobenzoyl-glutamate transporter